MSFAGVGHERLCEDMDAWGYSFRLGSTRAWFYGDAEDARLWLIREGVIDKRGRLTGASRYLRIRRSKARRWSATREDDAQPARA